MRTSTLITSYIQAVIFISLGISCVLAWRRHRDSKSAHLAWAAGLFGISSLMGAITTTFIDATKNETAPRWEGILSSIIIYLSVYAFLLFLSDFIRFPRAIHALLILVTAGNIVLSIIERADLRLDPKTFKVIPIPGVHNPISFRGYLSYVLIYLAVAFGALAVAFLIYGTRAAGLARFRMISIGAGFGLFSIAIGLVPRLFFGSSGGREFIINLVRYIALATGPLLFVGFAPPKFIRSRFPESESQVAR